MVQSKISYRGKNFLSSSLTESKLKITKEQLNYIRKNKTIDRFFYDRETGEILKFNLKSSDKKNDLTYNPTITRDFGAKKRITNKKF